jgi:hypothetical protein
MNVRNGDTVSAVAVVVESEAELGADVAENGDVPIGEAGNGEPPSAEGPDDGELPPEPGADSDNGSPNGGAV